MNTELVKADFLEARQVLDDFLADSAHFENIALAGELMVSAIRQKNKIYSCGNGGSMSDAMHFAEELSGAFRSDRRALPAMAISDPAHLTCTGNDYGFESVFSRFIDAHGTEGDVLLAISTSGNSDNVIKAAEKARAKNMKIVSLTGKTGGKLADLSDIEIRAPFTQFSDRCQEIHIKVIHSLIHFIEHELGLD